MQGESDDLSDAEAWAASLALSADDTSPDNLRRLSGPGLRAFLRIAEQWHLTADEQAQTLGMSHRDFARLSDIAIAGGSIELPVDALLRISAILGIYKALATLFDERGRLDWLNGAHDAPWCGGRRPIDVIGSGDVGLMIECRRYLDQLCG